MDEKKETTADEKSAKDNRKETITDKNLISKLKELREMVNESSEHTLHQLQSIDTNIFLGSILSLIIAVGVSFQLKILVYWIPSSFVIFYVWATYSIISVNRSKNQTNVDTYLQTVKQFDQSKLRFGVDWLFKNLTPFFKSLTLIYSITLIVLIMIADKVIAVSQNIDLTIPTISTILLLIGSLSYDSVRKIIDLSKIADMLSSMSENTRKRRMILGKTIFIIFYVLLLIILPIYSFIAMLKIVSDYFFLIIAGLLQFISIMAISSYFSSISAKKELTNTLTNFADIHNLINDAILSGNIKTEDYEKLKKLYLTAKLFDVQIDDSLKFVNFYYLLMNRTYLKNLESNV